MVVTIPVDFNPSRSLAFFDAFVKLTDRNKKRSKARTSLPSLARPALLDRPQGG